MQGEKNANQTIKPSHGVFLQSALCARQPPWIEQAAAPSTGPNQRLCVGLSRLPFASRAAVPCAPLLGPRAACCAHGPAARRVWAMLGQRASWRTPRPRPSERSSLVPPPPAALCCAAARCGTRFEQIQKKLQVKFVNRKLYEKYSENNKKKKNACVE